MLLREPLGPLLEDSQSEFTYLCCAFVIRDLAKSRQALLLTLILCACARSGRRRASIFPASTFVTHTFACPLASYLVEQPDRAMDWPYLSCGTLDQQFVRCIVFELRIRALRDVCVFLLVEFSDGYFEFHIAEECQLAIVCVCTSTSISVMGYTCYPFVVGIEAVACGV